jgi:antitoxin (DNA-binding transcriptional repressor) of toxin-antitoxin stability system
MGKELRKGAEEARNQLPDLLAAAEKGRSTIITRHGRPVAAWCRSRSIAQPVANNRLCRLQELAAGCGARIALGRFGN